METEIEKNQDALKTEYRKYLLTRKKGTFSLWLAFFWLVVFALLTSRFSHLIDDSLLYLFLSVFVCILFFYLSKNIFIRVIENKIAKKVFSSEELSEFLLKEKKIMMDEIEEIEKKKEKIISRLKIFEEAEEITF